MTLSASLGTGRRFPTSAFAACLMNTMHMGTTAALGFEVDCSMLVVAGQNYTSAARF